MKKDSYLKCMLLILTLLLYGTASAHDFEVDGIYYNINGNEATVTYRGISFYEYSNEYAGEIVVPEVITFGGVTYPVTTIGEYAFFGCFNLSGIDIPYSVTSIGVSAFEGCSGLTNIVIPNSVISIGESAFNGCSGLTNIVIPNSVTTIGSYAFSDCSGLTSITIPNSINNINDGTFYGCSGLTNIEIPNTATTIGNSAFSDCSGLTSIIIPNSVTTIGNYAFLGCSQLTSMRVESGNSIYDSRDNCNAVIETYSNTLIAGCKSTIIPNSITSIGMGAFRACTGLTYIEIPNTITYIGDWAFGFCTGLTQIEIGNSVTHIGNYAFSSCSNLVDIVIPNSITYIGNNAFSGTAWFNNQSDGVIYAGLVAYKYKGTMPDGTCISLRDGTTGIAREAFQYCYGLTNITIPNSVTFIGGSAFFGCSGLTNIVIPNSVTDISDRAFAVSGLKSIEIPNSVTSIGERAFASCKGITSIEIPYTLASIGEGAFGGCSGLTCINVENGNTIFDSRGNCNAIIETSSNTLIAGCKNTIIPNSITSIGYRAFNGCTELTNIAIPNSVSIIGRRAFSDCTGLANILIPNSVTNIGEGAFAGCTGLTNIVIPSSVTDIGDNAFHHCYGLTNIEIGNSVTHIGESVFWSCNNLTNVYCYATNPPSCFENTFEKYSATLHVPAASLATYFTSPYWSNFENIIGDAIVPTGLSISNDTIAIQLTEQFLLTASVTPANASNHVVTWFSTNTNIATVNNGIVTALSIGECDIIASCFGMQAICHVSVGNQIKLDKQEAMLLPNHMLVLTPTAAVMPNGFTATSSDPTVAAVRVMNGKVQVVGIKEGTTTITVGSTDSTVVPATCFVTVYTELGDLNSDGFVTIGDVTSLIDFLLGGDETSVTMKNADVNDDGNINIKDVTALIDNLLSGTTD